MTRPYIQLADGSVKVAADLLQLAAGQPSRSGLGILKHIEILNGTVCTVTNIDSLPATPNGPIITNAPDLGATCAASVNNETIELRLRNYRV